MSSHAPVGEFSLPMWTYEPFRSDSVQVTIRGSMEWVVTARALRDALFKAELTRDPKGVLRRDFGIDVPEDVSFQVVQEGSDEIIWVLPANPFPRCDEDQLYRESGHTLEDLARLVLQNRRGTLPDREQSASIVARAWRDEGFRSVFLRDPRQALHPWCDLSLLSGYRITALEETRSSIFLVLPHMESNGPEVGDPRRWEEANLGASYVMKVAQGSCDYRCLGTCSPVADTDKLCICTCVYNTLFVQ